MARARQRRSTGNCSTAASRRSPGTPWKNWSRRPSSRRCSPKRRAAAKPSDSPTAALEVATRQDCRREPPSSRSSRCARNWKSRSQSSVFFWPRQTGPEGRSGRRRDGPRAASARLEQHLHAADHQPHRDALDRRAHRHRRQSVRPGPGHDRPRLQGDRSGAQADQRRPRRDRRADHGQGLSGDRHRPREGGPLRHQVEDIQNEIEVALGGRVVTYTVEKRDRFPVRIRYARAYREDEESIRRLLVSPGDGMPRPPAMAADRRNGRRWRAPSDRRRRQRITPPPRHAGKRQAARFRSARWPTCASSKARR